MTHVSVVAGVVLFFFIATAPLQAAQTPDQAETATTTLSVRDWTRLEMWRFFEPPASGGDSEYLYGANRLQLGVRRTTSRYELAAALQYVHFGNLPSRAVGPGPLGLGAVYFSHAGRSDSHQVYLRYLNLRLKNLLPGLVVDVGRMPYSSGGEAASGNPKIELVKRQRIEARLVGEFDWSVYQRGFDGVRVAEQRPRWGATFVAFHPTQGGFEDAAGLMMRDISVIGGNITFKPGFVIRGTEWQAFVLRYADHRAVTARPDNSGRGAAAADLGINTFGTTLVGAWAPREGRQWDGLLWLTGQTGSWYELRHRALSVAAEVGHQWTNAPWRPWLRVGVLHASGDRDPRDDRHGTFFQLLPTVRRYAQTATYSQMNNVDLSMHALLRPTSSLAVRLDLHRVSLASSRDFWYFGSGATQARGTQFGFATRPSNGHRHLGTGFESSADVTISRQWSVNGFLGLMRAGDVVRSTFAGRTMAFGYVENVLQF
jgi:hypothetical protein